MFPNVLGQVRSNCQIFQIKFVIPTKLEDEGLPSVRSKDHDIRSEDVDTHGTVGPQVYGSSATYEKNCVRGFSAESNPKRELKSPTQHTVLAR
jgi:hypothetical protein